MDYNTWSKLSTIEKENQRDYSDLNPFISQYRGCRIEATDKYGETRRFWVGQSTGWKPCTLEVKTTRSLGGEMASGEYTNIKVIKWCK